MPPARSLILSLRWMGAPAFAAALSLATSFAGQRQLNEAPPVPERIAAPQALAADVAPDAVPNGFVINPSSREASRIFFRTVYAASENVAIGWNGSVTTGDAGTTSVTFKAAVQRRVNYFRAMSGVSAGINFTADKNARDQQAALMMSANNALNHAPPNTWDYYTPDGAAAAGHSDLFLGSYGPAAITGYIEDFGSPNAEVGHRRWIFYPQTTEMGTGDIPVDGTFNSANALWVATAPGLTRPAVRDDFVAWPPPGFVPYSLVFPRWSFSYPGATFTNTTVTMKRGGVSVPVAIQNRGPGAGEETIVWAWDNLDANVDAPPGPPPASDTPVQVAVNGVVIGGVSRNFSYTVTLFDPAKAGADTVPATVSGPAQPAVGASASYTCNTVPDASGYQFRTAPLSALTAIEGAENGTANVTVDAPAGYAIVSAAFHAGGAKSFHFTTPDFDTESITLNRTVLASATTQLKFKSRLGYATTDQVAHAQVSTDEGSTWDTLFTAAGTGAPAAGFSDQTVSLAAYANHTIQVRFIFACEGENAFTQTDDNVGWYLDDVSFSNAQELTGATLSAVSASTAHSFTPAVAGSYAVQARGQFFGDYLFAFGSVLAVSAVVNGAPQIATPPADRTAPAGGTAQFSVVASGPGTLTYQWFHGTQSIPGATAATLNLTGVLPGDAGSYLVKVTNAFGTTPSAAATLTVTVPNPVVTTGAGNALSDTAVKLSGHVEVNAQTVACGFEYGATASLGSTAAAGTASAATDFVATISSLTASTTIYYRAFADINGGTRFRGAVKTIATMKPIAALNVTVDPAGGGTVSGLPAGAVHVGDAIALTAQPASGFGFTGWTGGLTKTTAALAFPMPASLTLVAHFSSSPIVNAAGRYRGLALTAPATHDSCGFVTLTVAAKGAFTGQAVIGGAKFALRGVFDAGGVAHFGTTTEATLRRTGKVPLLLRLNLPAGNATPSRVVGDVRETPAGFTASIDAARVIFTAAKNPAAPLLNPPATWPGAYTADLTVSAATPVAGLAGRGWITATVGKDGSMRFVGALADGARWTSTQPLVAAGTVPIYVALYGGKGSVFGEVQFAGAPVTLGSAVNWFRPAKPGPRFTAGWPGGVQLTLAGGAWTPFKPGVTWPLPGLGIHAGAAHLWANGGTLPPNLDWAVTFALATGRATVTPATSGASASFVGNATTGIFTGTFKTSAKSTPVGFSGALVPGSNRARGYFLTPTGSGAVSLLPQ